MKIVFLSSSLAPRFGGAAFSESSLAGKLSEQHEVHVLSRKERMDEMFARQQGIKIITGFHPVDVLLAFLNPQSFLSQLIRSADVFHLNGHWYWENYFFAKLAKRYGVPYYLHPRGMLLVGHRRKRLKKIFNLLIGNWIVKNAEGLIALSHYEKEQFIPYSYEKENISIIPNPIDVPKFPENPNRKQDYFLYIGRIEKRKNLGFLIQSFAKVLKKYPKVVLKFVGPVEHQYDEELISLASTLGVLEQVEFLPPVYEENKFRMYEDALGIIYPATDEPYGRVPFEAMAAGSLPLVPRESGSAEYIEKAFPELIYPQFELNALADKMEWLINLSANQKREMGQKAKAWVGENLNWPTLLPQFLYLYEVVQ